MNNKEEVLCKFVEYNDLENIEKLLKQGNLLFAIQLALPLTRKCNYFNTFK